MINFVGKDLNFTTSFYINVKIVQHKMRQQQRVKVRTFKIHFTRDRRDHETFSLILLTT